MFIQSCYIKKNTKELREKLKSLGYKLNHGKAWGKYLACFKTEDTNECKFVASPDYDLKNMPNFTNSINCGENEDLFLAIAAIRDDSDYMQYFVCDEDYITYSMNEHKKGEFILFDGVKAHINKAKPFWHKATVQELIEHFKSK